MCVCVCVCVCVSAVFWLHQTFIQHFDNGNRFYVKRKRFSTHGFLWKGFFRELQPFLLVLRHGGHFFFICCLSILTHTFARVSYCSIVACTIVVWVRARSMIFTTCGIFTVCTTSNCVARALLDYEYKASHNYTTGCECHWPCSRTTAVQSTIGHSPSLFIIVTLGTRCKCYVVIFVIHVQDSNCFLYYIYACAFWLTKLKLLVHCMWHSAECFAPWCFINTSNLQEIQRKALHNEK